MAVDFLGLRRNGSSLRIIDQARDFPEQVPRHSNLGRLECDIATMTNDLGPDLHQLLPQCGQRPMLDLLWQGQRAVLQAVTIDAEVAHKGRLPLDNLDIPRPENPQSWVT